jgi:hypothetical protein
VNGSAEKAQKDTAETNRQRDGSPPCGYRQRSSKKIKVYPGHVEN